MGTLDYKLSELVGIVKSLIPGRSNQTNVSRDFWMPDQSCRVCYECDAQFTVFIRRHHCRICGRVFCAKCTLNSVPAPFDVRYNSYEDCGRIRVCVYCFEQQEQGLVVAGASGQGLSPSASVTSLASTQSSWASNGGNSIVGSTLCPTEPYHHDLYNFSPSSPPSVMVDPVEDGEDKISPKSVNPITDTGVTSPDQFSFCKCRSGCEDDAHAVYCPDPEMQCSFHTKDYYVSANLNEADQISEPRGLHSDEENIVTENMYSSLLPDNLEKQSLKERNETEKEADGHDQSDEAEAPIYDVKYPRAASVDFENSGFLWLPPEPENEEDERETELFDDDDDDAEGSTGEWGHIHSSNFGSGEHRSRDNLMEEHRKAMNNVVEGHFRALVAQLLQVENLPVSDDDGKESWLDVITSLSWEAATLLKPDTSTVGGMDPSGYVKVKCIACGHPCESVVVKGVVCKKNVAHRRMTSKIDKPRLLILGGALEYQRVSSQLSSFDTLLQQEMDHLKMAVAKIDAHHPNVLLVEKSVSRFAQEYLLAKDISLVLNVKRPLLERIARCTGAQIVLSIDHLTSQKLGYCETFHVDKFLEEHGSAGQGGKKLTKTLMFFEGCPKPLGCTILLKGASGDELKKLKHVVQYGVFAAHHLALETSFLADEGASPSELPSKSPITVSLPNKPSIVERSISPVPGFNIPDADKPQHPPYVSEQIGPHDCLNSDLALLADVAPICKSVVAQSACLSEGPSCQVTHAECASSPTEFGDSSHSLSYVGKDITSSYHNKASLIQMLENTKANSEDFLHEKFTSQTEEEDALVSNGFSGSQAEDSTSTTGHQYTSDLTTLKQDNDNNHQKMGYLKEEFPDFSLSPSDNHNILVALSRRCVWKGTVCERSHFFRIKYYGISDKPLGRFLHDQLFDQSRRCRSCEMPPEAHIQCYTNRQGSLTISVKKLPDFTLPGEQEGKIWMWHRCLRCPRSNGFPPATRRIVMSDAAWGLSFGKFLELSFSNHAAASRVASCGHSLHRDCLRFYGFGRMVACFRYASIDLHSVYLPPSKLDFTYENQEWIQKEADEVRNRAEVLFKELYEDLHQILEKITGASSVDGAIGRSDHIHHISELELLLHIEKQDFEELLWKALNKEAKSDQPAVDILEINKLRRQLLFHSYMWEQRLMHAVGLKSSQEGLTSSMPKPQSQENPLSAAAKQYTSSDSYLVGPKLVKDGYEDKEGSYLSLPDGVHTGLDQDLNHKEGQTCPYTDTSNHSDILGARKDMRRVPSEGEVSIISDLSDTLDAAWTGENQTGSTKENIHKGSNLALADSHSSASVQSVAANPDVHKSIDEGSGTEIAHSFGSSLPPRKSDSVENFKSWVDTSLSFNRSLNKNPSWKYQKFGIAGEYNPVHAPSYWELEHRDGARLLLPVGVNDTVIPVYDDEPSSIISYALVSSDYNVQISEPERSKDSLDSSVSLPLLDSVNFLSLSSFVESISESYRSIGSSDESVSGSRSSQNLGPLLYTMDLHVRVSFTDDGPQGKVRYTVTCYYAKRFDALRKTCCSSELDFVRSLSRCKKWGAQGGKSNVFFAKTMDDRYIIKQVTKTELESFIKFAPSYFKYLSEFISTGSPTCLAKILGIYQVTTKHLKGGKESRMDVLVMENLLFKRNVTRLYDLKGSSRSRYNSDSSGNNKVLLDQNLIEAMPTSPIFLGTKAKRQLERAVWNDTSFLASIYVMDYSLLVGVDEEKHELVLGIIDFMRQYTWDKHLETWVKASGILGGPKNSEPTVISPKQYKKRFRKAMSAYFVMVPDQWSLLPFIPSGSQPDLCQDNAQAGASSLH